MSESGTDNLFQIARVLKSNGIGGDILMGFRDIEPDEVDLQEPVFVSFDGLPVPFFIESLEPKGKNRALVHLSGIDSLEDAEEITGREVYADADSYEDICDDVADITGWEVLSGAGEKLGTITAFEDIPGNPCVYIRTSDGSEAMVPLHDDFIVSVEQENRTIVMDLPDGLL